MKLSSKPGDGEKLHSIASTRTPEPSAHRGNGALHCVSGCKKASVTPCGAPGCRGDEPFGVLLGTIMYSEKPVLRQLIDASEKYDVSAVGGTDMDMTYREIFSLLLAPLSGVFIAFSFE